MAPKPNPVDTHVGARIRLRRTRLGMSQQRLGAALGLTFQQVQKYEHGINRVGAARLFELGRVLDVPVTFFFAGLEPPVTTARAMAGAARNGSRDHDQPDPPLKRETLDFVSAYLRIADPRIRRRLFELAKGVANARRSVPKI
jgi:transcriptional regulator with XRE-family HTH domain